MTWVLRQLASGELQRLDFALSPCNGHFGATLDIACREKDRIRLRSFVLLPIADLRVRVSDAAALSGARVVIDEVSEHPSSEIRFHVYDEDREMIEFFACSCTEWAG